MAKQNTFSFEPYRKVRAAQKEACRKGVYINVKQGLLVFPNRYIEDKNLDRRYIKWYVDPTKMALGWKILDHEADLPSLKDYVLVKRTTSNNQYRLSVKKLLSTFKFRDKNVSFHNLTVSVYTPSTGYLGETPVNYVTLTDPKPIASKRKQVK